MASFNSSVYWNKGLSSQLFCWTSTFQAVSYELYYKTKWGLVLDFDDLSWWLVLRVLMSDCAIVVLVPMDLVFFCSGTPNVGGGCDYSPLTDWHLWQEPGGQRALDWSDVYYPLLSGFHSQGSRSEDTGGAGLSQSVSLFRGGVCKRK